MNQRTYKLKIYKEEVSKLFKEKPQAEKLENHYKCLYYILKKRYPKAFNEISRLTLDEILYDTVYLDRYLRRQRQGKQNKIKNILARDLIHNL